MTSTGRATVRHPNRLRRAMRAAGFEATSVKGECVTVFFESAKRTYDQRRAGAR